MTLPRSLARRLSLEADVTGSSASAIVREALQGYFARQAPEPLPSFVGMGDSGRNDVAERADELLDEIMEERFRRKIGR